MSPPDDKASQDRELRVRADRILADALEVQGAARHELIDRRCSDDGVLRTLVLDLVARCDETDDLEELLHRSLVAVHSDLERSALGTDRVGPYLLGAEIGRGGMGVVYRGRRADGLFEHEVAVKVLQVGRVEHLGERFARERQIQATLDHPGIARLLDAGSTPGGLPYLVMEFVEGQRIDQFCAEQRLSIDARLRLFAAVCEAVESAHHSLVVHRDLKPSNILVTQDGKPKLLDFGIAKVLADESTSGLQDTARMMTLEWASPEQLAGAPTTVQTDVYQLGLLLHVLLTGRLPYAVSDLPPVQQVAVICKHEVRAPSTTVRQLPPEEASAWAEQLVLPPGRIATALSGDLDAIVLRALRKDPRQRYESVERLRRDVECHLQRLPVSARLPTLRYRAARFLQRHLVASITTLVVLAAFATLAAFSFSRIAEERDIARREARRAEQRERESQAATDFLAGLLRKASPHHRDDPEELTVRQAIDLGLEQLATELRDTPPVRARVVHELSDVFMTLGDTERAIDLGEEAADLWRRAGDDYRSELASSLLSLAVAYQTHARHDLARPLFQQALELRRDLHGPDHPTVAQVYSDLAILSDMEGDGETAGQLFDQALAILDATDEEAFNGQQAILLCNLGIFHKNQGVEHRVPGAFEKSASAMQRCVTELSAKPELASRVPTHYVNLGNLYYEMDRFAESEASLRRALTELTSWFGDDHPNIALARSNLGRTLIALGRFDEAESELQQALVLREAAFGDRHPRVAIVLQRLGELRLAEERWHDARPLLERALDIERTVYGPEHPSVGGSLRALARCHRGEGDARQAAELFRQAIEVYQAAGRDEDAADLEWELAKLGAPVIE